MALTRLEVSFFTAFLKMDMSFSPGINVIIGPNGTGKTHLLKLLYSACDATRGKKDFASKLRDVFFPFQDKIGRLAYRIKGSIECSINVYQETAKLSALFSNHTKSALDVEVFGKSDWEKKFISCTFIPVKEMLAHAPGFRSLYSERYIPFEEIYFDIIDRAFLPAKRKPMGADRLRLLDHISCAIKGKVITKGETFFLKNSQGELEFSLVAEGFRKLALLWLLIQNDTLLSGSVLFWDEPEANLNPKTIGIIAEILLDLQRQGVQIFISTHDYVILKELDLRKKEGDKIVFHSLYREKGIIEYQIADKYQSIHPNSIADAFLDLYDRDVARALNEGRAS